MKNFAIRFSMKCNEKQWKDSGVQKPLEEMGYDFSELGFYPNKEYVCTFYKDQKGKISTTNKPFEKDRKVIHEWIPDLFLALCSQREGSAVMVGEWVRVIDSGIILQCTTLHGNYVGTTVTGSKSSPAYKSEQVEKATYFELSNFFINREMVNLADFKEVIVTVKTEALEKRLQEKQIISPSDITVTAEEFTKARMESDFKSNPLKIIPEQEKKPVQIDVQTVEPITIKGENLALIDLRKPITASEIRKVESSIDAGLSLIQITDAFKDKKKLTVGRVTDNEIQCQEASIEWISHTHVKFFNNEPIKHDQLFLSREAFILYALKQLSPSKK